MTVTVKTFVLTLPCGCPASWVHAEDLVDAARILWNENPPPWITKGCRFVQVRTVKQGEKIWAELQKAGARRRECRGFHKAGKP